MIEAHLLVNMTVEYDGEYRDINEVMEDVKVLCVSKGIDASDRDMRIIGMEMF